MRRRIPYVRQMEAADCGAACLGMVLRYFGKRVPLDELRDATSTDRGGVSAVSIIHAAGAYGLRARGVRADIDALRRVPRGTILHWEFSHFLVLDRVTRRGIVVVDPAYGRRFMPFKAIRDAYTGVAIVFNRTRAFDRTSAPSSGSWRYLRPALRQAQSLARVIVSSLVLRLIALALPLLTALVVDEVVPHGDRHLLLVLIGGTLVLVAYSVLTSFLRANLLLELRTRLDISLTTGFVDHLVALPYAFFARRSSGDLMMRLQSNGNVREIMTTSSLSGIIDGTFAVLFLGILLVVSPPLTLLVAGIAAAQVATMVLSWGRNQRLMSESLQVEARAQSYAYELLAGMQTLKAAGAERRAVDHWQRLFTDQVNATLARGRLTALVDSIMGTWTVAAPLLVLLAAAYQVMRGDMSLGTMLAAVALATGFLAPLGTLVSSCLQLQLLGSYMSRINDVLDAPLEQASGTRRPAPRLTGQIRAEGVSFAYGPLAPIVVRNVSLEITPGEHIGIAGRSGSGKSTLAHLLLGLYRPAAGAISFDGASLDDVELTSLRRQLGIVTQRPYLFASSIRDNISLTDPSLPLERVIEAAEHACIHDDIAAMPMGYDTVLQDGGASLSGGQRQRIALARALVNRPPILVLDEATSELDTVTEQLVYQRLAGIAATTVVIAHRLSTIRGADRIFVMDAGSIVESGTHAELAAAGGTYASLVNAQPSLAVDAYGGRERPRSEEYRAAALATVDVRPAAHQHGMPEPPIDSPLDRAGLTGDQTRKSPGR
jgi:ATP-binding cassette, subfamily B, bacterial